MVCFFSGKSLAIVFEHKTWRHLHTGQIRSYRKYASKAFDRHYIVLITATRQQHEQDPDLGLCWSDVCDIISDWHPDNTSEDLVTDFSKLLRSVGLGPPAPISHTSIRYYFQTRHLTKNIRELVGRIEGRERRELQLKGVLQGARDRLPNLNLRLPPIEEDYRLAVPSQRGREDYWGRIGLELLWDEDNDHGPGGLFVGILVDGTDHCTEPLDLDKGPDFCLIISFSYSLLELYGEKRSYRALVASLQEKVAGLDDGWDFYNHLIDEGASEKNLHHPLHIRKPMLDVLAGTETCEDQEDRFYSSAQMLVELVAEEGAFWELRQDLRQASD